MAVEQGKITLRMWAGTKPIEDGGAVVEAVRVVLARLERLEQQRDAAADLAREWERSARRMRLRYEALGAVSSVALELERCAAQLRALGEPVAESIPPDEAG